MAPSIKSLSVVGPPGEAEGRVGAAAEGRSANTEGSPKGTTAGAVGPALGPAADAEGPTISPAADDESSTADE